MDYHMKLLKKAVGSTAEEILEDILNILSCLVQTMTCPNKPTNVFAAITLKKTVI